MAGAAVFVTRGPDRAVKQTTTDSSGRWALTFENGTGDYLVAVTAVGYKSARRRVQAEEGSHDLVADFTLVPDLSTLAAVKVTAAKPVRASDQVSPYQVETGANEKWADGVNGQLSPSVAGDLNALMGTMPGITVGAGGPSLLGAGTESNLTTLNGMAMPASSIPRAAQTDTRVSGATYDATRGGFSGANVDVVLAPGSRTYQRRNAFLTLDSPSMQFTDAVGRSLGARTGLLKGSVGLDGELIRRALTYNVSLEMANASSDPATLLRADGPTFIRAGVAPDSAARLIATANARGIPLSGVRVPGEHQRDGITWLGRLDDTRDTLDTRTFTSYFSLVHDGALGFAPLSAPAAGGERRDQTVGLQFQAGNYYGDGRRTLNQTRVGFSQVSTETTPYLALPAASVLVNSTTIDGDALAALGIGGSAYLAAKESRWLAEGSNETLWTAGGRKHLFKVLGWARADGLEQRGLQNRYGQYTFNSIGDLAAGTPSSFSRTLSQPDRSGMVWNAAAAFAHQWAPSRTFSLLYGARLEAAGFGTSPAANPALATALGVGTGTTPTLLHVSPRIGFSYTYSREKENGNGSSQNPVGRFYRNTTGVIRGGIGEFRDLLRPDLLAEASARTGLAGSTQQLACVGSAVPAPDWSGFLADPGTVPTSCVGGGGLLTELAPPATIIDRSYDVPRSWRASLDWNSNLGRWIVRVSGLASYDLNQPGTVDANFAGVSRFALAGEGNRPVYVSTRAIDTASGAVSATEARRSPSFGRVGVRMSDLRGYGGQLTFAVAPDMFRMRGVPGSAYASLAYTLQEVRREYRGFDGAAFGDPSVREWAPGANDARHIFVLTAGFYTEYTGTLTFAARAQSGLPFTPVVQGDVNGDGRSGDRAFVPNAGATADTSLARQLRDLLAGGSATARECVQAFAGRVADRNGCRGPWTATLNAQWRPPLPSFIARRFTAAVYLDNVLGAVDQLVNGAEHLQGWGAPAQPDPVLLVARGFDSVSKAFRYSVNPRFAETRPERTLSRAPFRLTIDFTLRFHTDYDLQQLRRALEPVKVETRWERRSADSLASFYLSNTSSIHKAMLEESDSLFLSRAQVIALRRADSTYSARVRAVFVPLGVYLSQFADGVATKAALDSANASEKLYQKIFWEQPEIADSIVTPTQRELMPMLKGMLSIPKKEREHNQWQFGRPVKLRDEKRSATTR